MSRDVFTRAEDVADALHERIVGITTANGYESNIGLNLFKGRRKIPADDELPCTFVIEGNDFPREQQETRVRNEQPYVLWGFGPCDPNNPNVAAHAMIRDIKKAVWGGPANLGGRARSVNYVSRDIGPRPDGGAFVQVEVRLTVEFAEDLRNP